MPPPPPFGPSRRQVTQWVDSGLITPQQGMALLAVRSKERPQPTRPAAARAPPPSPTPAAPAAPARPRRGLAAPWRDAVAKVPGPRPLWQEAVPALIGLAAGLVVAVVAVLADTLLASHTRLQPGHVLLVTPWAFGVAFASAGASPRLRPAAFTAAATSLALATMIHPSPPGWLETAPVLAILAVLAARIDAATRVVAAAPACFGLLLTSWRLFESSDLATMASAAVVLLALFALSFEVPFDSGWRGVPMLVLAASAAALVLALVGLNLLTLFLGDGSDVLVASHPDPVGVLLRFMLVVGYPALVWLAWTRDEARRFTLRVAPKTRHG